MSVEHCLDTQFACFSTVQSVTVCVVLEFDMCLQLDLIGI